ncbi:RNA-binding domain-containing protein [Daedalea quercina L-15889]|uniref:RNA-binding domain-containing protein n=1 Tax=Daedalea quercina L-15889 TaxID=1314783 RepID=A0A165SWL2_9APHY|nr:RNA-binding domain-containing protein [Daedalea quercina L-15889]
MSDAPAATVTENGAPPATQEKVVEETPGFKVFAGNLAYSTTDEGLKAFFAPVASDILTAQVIFRGTRSAGYGFVSMATAEAAQKAVELLDKQELDGRQVIVEVAKPAEQKDKEKKEKKASKRRPGRRGSKSVPGEVSEAEANGDAEKAEGATSAAEGEKPKKKKKNSRKSKAAKKAAAAAEGGEAAADAAPAADGEAAKKPRARKPKAPKPPRPAGEDPAGEPSKTVLFVANLGFSIDDAGLAKLFTDADIPVSSARIVRRRWGKPRKSKGYGFVDVGDEEQQKKAIELLQGKEVEGRAIAVKIAVNSQTEEGVEDAPVENGEAKPEREATPEQEAREEGLSKSLFERAKDEEATGQRSKALAMMMKMGYKPGESLGQKYDDPQPAESSSAGRKSAAEEDEPADVPTTTKQPRGGIGHRIEPLPLNEWVGKTGIGLRKRAASPSASERLAKMAKLAEEADHTSFRDRARQEYEDRQAEGRLAPAQRTCINLDEKDGRKFNILWLNPENPDTFPEGLIEDLDDPDFVTSLSRQQAGDTIEGRLRVKMRADALQPLTSTLEDDEAQPEEAGLRRSPYSEEEIQEARQFLRLSAKHRLQLVLDYLRQRYAYCFWCGTEYDNQEDMDQNCPGPEEEAHD